MCTLRKERACLKKTAAYLNKYNRLNSSWKIIKLKTKSYKSYW
jgi:hypothetical protein